MNLNQSSPYGNRPAGQGQDAAKPTDEYFEETNYQYTKERLSYVGLISILGIIAILVAIAQIVLCSIHLSRHDLDFVKLLTVAAVFFLIGAILSVYWSSQAKKVFKASTELYQPKVNEDVSRVVFMAGLVLAGIAAVCLAHLYVEIEYSPDYVAAQDEEPDSFFRTNFIIQSIFVGFFFFYFLLASRAAFACLKWGNQAMSQLVFLGNLLLLAFALGVIYFADYAFNYDEYVPLRANFPVWNIRGLYFVGMALLAASVVGFLVDHKSWRIGFFVLAFLLLVLLVLLATFTGFAYRHTRHTYEYYKGVTDSTTCIKRMNAVHLTDLEDYGCPAKYLDFDQCAPSQNVYKWEGTNADPSQSALLYLLGATDEAVFQNAADTVVPVYCLNTACCGILGQLYSKHLIQLAAFGLLATMAACLVSIGCYYFWYVTWVDTARDKNKDYIWLVLMGLVFLAFVIVCFAVSRSYIVEKEGTNAL